MAEKGQRGRLFLQRDHQGVAFSRRQWPPTGQFGTEFGGQGGIGASDLCGAQQGGQVWAGLAFPGFQE